MIYNLQLLSSTYADQYVQQAVGLSGQIHSRFEFTILYKYAGPDLNDTHGSFTGGDLHDSALLQQIFQKI